MKIKNLRSVKYFLSVGLVVPFIMGGTLHPAQAINLYTTRIAQIQRVQGTPTEAAAAAAHFPTLIMTNKSGQFMGSYPNMAVTMKNGVLCSLTGSKLPTIQGVKYGLYYPAGVAVPKGAGSVTHLSGGAIAGITIGSTVGGAALGTAISAAAYGFAAGAATLPEAWGIAITVATAAVGLA